MDPIPSESSSAPVTRDDAQELASFGYTQQLRRTMGSFSSFAVAFSLISVITGVTANFGHGLQLVGGGVLSSWLIVLCGQSLLALLLAELSNRMPLSGYGYQWTSRLMNPHYGFFVGWLLMLQFITGFPGVCATLGSQLGQWLGGDWMDSRGFVVLTLCVITLTTLIHLFGIRLASLVNDTGVWTEMLGVLGVGTILIVHALTSQPSAAVLVDTTQLGSGDTAGMAGWALSLLVGAWCLTGFEAAADMAEETHQPRKVVPRAMLLSLFSSGLAGAVLIGGTLLAMPDLKEAQAMSDPLMQTLESVVGGGWMSVIRIVILISIFACGLACMSATSRLLFSLARDSMLPGSGLVGPSIFRAGCATQCDPADLPALFACHRFSSPPGHDHSNIGCGGLHGLCRNCSGCVDDPGAAAYGWFSTWRCPAGAGDLGFLLGAWGRAGSDRAAQRD